MTIFLKKWIISANQHINLAVKGPFRDEETNNKVINHIQTKK